MEVLVGKALPTWPPGLEDLGIMEKKTEEQMWWNVLVTAPKCTDHEFDATVGSRATWEVQRELGRERTQR